MLAMYWEIGNTILQQQKALGWGAKIVDRLSADLRTEFPEMKGLSVRNLKYMRAFAEAYPDFNTFGQPQDTQISVDKKQLSAKVQGRFAQNKSISETSFVQTPAAQIKSTEIYKTVFVQTLSAQIPWSHHQLLLDKVKDQAERFFYMQKCVENGWSHNFLSEQIQSNLFKRQGKTISNFSTSLPAIDSDLVRETFKNPYVFDFLMIGKEAQERELERALIKYLKKFMLELGKGFAYVGNQFNLEVNDDEYFLDLLFYN